MEFVDRILTCTDCGGEFIFTAGEQLFFLDKQFKNDPKRCKPCKSRRAAGAPARLRVAVRRRLASRAPRPAPNVRSAASRPPSPSSPPRAARCCAANVTRTRPSPALTQRRPPLLPREQTASASEPATSVFVSATPSAPAKPTAEARRQPHPEILRRECLHGDLISANTADRLRALKAGSPECRGLR